MTALSLPTVSPAEPTVSPKPWIPKRVVFTPAALEEPFGQSILQRVAALGLPIERLKANRLTGLRGETERDTYKTSKSTLAVVVAPPSAMKLQPIPPSADWQFHLAEGCPGHCQYCYLAGSLSGPPVVRAFANLPAILTNLPRYEQPGRETTFEVSCYTDPLAIEHLTGSLSECVRHFATRPEATLRWVSKYSAVTPLLGLQHHGRTRCRASVNVAEVERLEGGTARVEARLGALQSLAQAGYPVGLVVAPIMPVENWEIEYTSLIERAATRLDFDCDLTLELITHRFTPGSKDLLQQWYPATKLDFDESKRAEKRNKFGGVKYVYPKDIMRAMRGFFEREIARRLPKARILYWT